MAPCSEVPKYELVYSKKCIPEEEKYKNYLLETLNKKPENNFLNNCPYEPTPTPYPTSKTFYGHTTSNYPNAGYNSTVNYYNHSNAFTGFNRLPKQTTLEFGLPIEDPNIINNDQSDFKKFKTEETFSLNTLQELDKNLESLKRENEEYKKFRTLNKNPQVYITQEEIKREKERLFGSIDDLKKYLENRKDQKIIRFRPKPLKN